MRFKIWDDFAFNPFDVFIVNYFLLEIYSAIQEEIDKMYEKERSFVIIN